MTLCGSLVALLKAQWVLTGDLATAKIAFHEGWFDKGSLVFPQVTVNEIWNHKEQYYSPSTVDFEHHYAANVWYSIPRGEEGLSQISNAESMKDEVVRIVNVWRHGIANLNIIVPLDKGIPHHEFDSTPRIARYEVSIFGVDSIVGTAAPWAGQMAANSGDVTILAGNTSATVTHLLATTPDIDKINLTPEDDLSGRSYFVSNVGALTFRINISSSDAVDHVIGWNYKI